MSEEIKATAATTNSDATTATTDKGSSSSSSSTNSDQKLSANDTAKTEGDAKTGNAEKTTTLGGKIEETKTAEGDKKEGTKPEAAPEKYDFKLPEGMKLESESQTQFETFAKQNNLTQEKAQSLVDIAAKTWAPKLREQFQKELSDQYEAQGKAWMAELAQDKTYGGTKAKETTELAQYEAQHAIKQFPELKALFDCGWGNYPALIKYFAEAGRARKEGGLAEGDQGTRGKSAAELFYTNTPKT